MKKKNILFLILVLAIFTISAGCAPNTKNSPTPVDAPIESNEEEPEEESEELLLTLEELAEFDGKDGRPAYVAVNGVIYDVTDSQRWSGGEHNGFEAGQDLTEEIENVSPHGVRTLENVPAVGRIVE
ncbi:putative heme/steroid binding protein [Acetoanaerobium pronyense]|uniref:Heme/steroid binding protein n=1 Tax=Acetoanaerobium pronyense TaxID=1482736 RepID=A0ABS4KML4_9FIRM|nr:cytochrome b5 domain-containing protein [Acetoanaerobium pronyense]MBP2028575.1 putative heme/steroid binding protein [Acetoanaerobium pronyense]